MMQNDWRIRATIVLNADPGRSARARDREYISMNRRTLQISVVSIFVSVLLLVVGTDTTMGQVTSDVDRFVFESRTYELDGYDTLFAPSTSRGRMRRALFMGYVIAQRGGRVASSGNWIQRPQGDLGNMADDEKATFVAVTAALHCVEVDANTRMSAWISRIDEIHGISDLTEGRWTTMKHFASGCV